MDRYCIIFVGTISKNIKNYKYASFVFNTKQNKPGKIKNNTNNFTSYRKPNKKEKEIINKELNKKN